MRTPLEQNHDLTESVQLLHSALGDLPYGTPAHNFIIDAVRHLTAQMEPIQHAILADFFECGCGDIVAVGDDHQCAYIEACAQEDAQSRNYAQRVM
jgi:hypothetical protein